jgi:DNA modification methylase
MVRTSLTLRTQGRIAEKTVRRNSNNSQGKQSAFVPVVVQGQIKISGKRPFVKSILTDARRLPITDNSVDLVITSPPYWQKRDYKIKGQIGHEKSPDEYVSAIMTALTEWRRVLRPSGSVFLNVGDTWHKDSLASIPSRISVAALANGWLLRNRIIWAKTNGVPDPVKNRLASRHEYILHFTVEQNYYFDLFGFIEKFEEGRNPGDVWLLKQGRNHSNHLAPFPEEVVDRLLTLACPKEICIKCGEPRRRIVKKTKKLDPNRPQAVRAMEIAKNVGLTVAHIKAIQATGINDAGKALKIQNGAGGNSLQVRKLADEAKEMLGGYFREFTFPLRETKGWTKCNCSASFRSGIVLDPFMGTGTTLKVARQHGYSAIGADLNIY